MFLDKNMSMGKYKKDVTPLLTHWSFVFLALNHRCVDSCTATMWLCFFFELLWCAILYMPDHFYSHDDVIEWKHFLCYWPFVRGIHRSPVNSPNIGQRRGALMFSLICVWINGWVNNGEAGDLRRNRAHYDVIVMKNILAMSYWSREDIT